MYSKEQIEAINLMMRDEFPVIYEQGKASAYIVSIKKFREIELLVDNPMHLREEDEDALIREAGVLDALIARARKEVAERGSAQNWKEQIDAI